jgi:hemolysin-activating ACP:hemolysin acyltransferase
MFYALIGCALVTRLRAVTEIAMSKKVRTAKDGAPQGDTSAAMNGSAPEGEAAAPAPAVTPEMMAKIGELRSKIQISVGQIVLTIMNLPRYRHQTLADLGHLLINPLLRDRLAIAHRSVTADDGSTKIDEENVAGIAIWATVSDEVDAKIAEQVKAGVFPVRLGGDDWTSGEQVWLLDVIAADRQAATAVLTNFRQVAGDKQIKVHPIVGRLIDPKVLERLRVGSDSAPSETASAE